MGRFLRNRFFVLVAVAGLTFITATVFAQSNALPVPVHISTGAAVPAGLQSTVTFDARGVGTAANAGYYSKPVLVSNNTLGQLGKGLLRRSVPVAAMTAAVTAAGWAIDELTGQVMDGPVPVPPGDVPPGGAYYKWGDNFYSSAGAATSAIISAMDYPGAPHTSHRWPGGDDGNVKAVCHHHNAWGGDEHLAYSTFTEHINETAFPQPYPWADVVTAPAPVADEALGQLVASDPALANAALHNADGSVNRNPDVMAAAQALAQQLASADPVEQPDPVGEWNTGQQGGPQNNPSPTALEFPAFCSWASKMCELADYLLDGGDDVSPDDDQEIEEIPLVLDQSWSSGFSGGSCPVPVSVNVLDAEVLFSYQPLCDLAGYIRPIMLSGTALLCVMIIGGFRRAS